MNIDFMNDNFTKDNLTIKAIESTGDSWVWRVYDGDTLVNGSYNYKGDCKSELEAIREARRKMGLHNDYDLKIATEVLDLETGIYYESIADTFRSQCRYKRSSALARSVYDKVNKRYLILK